MLKNEDVKQLEYRCRKDPLFFSEHILGNEKPWQKQIQIMEAIKSNPVVCVPSGHSTGKSWVSARIGLWFLYSFSPSIVLTTSSSWLQLQRVLWSEISRQHRMAQITLGGELLNLQLRLDTNWYMLGLSTDSPENFSGYHSQNLLIIVDEGSALEKPIFESIQGCLTGTNSRLLMIGNPLSSSGVFFDACKDEKSKVINISSWEAAEVAGNTGLATKSWCQDRLREWGESSPLYVSRVLGKFPDESDDILFPFSLVQKATQNKVPVSDKDVVLVGCDPARYGTDKTALIVMKGLEMIHYSLLSGKSTMEVVGHCIALKRKFNARAFAIDPIGIGSGCVDRLREQKFIVYDINFSSAPKNRELFENMKSEGYWQLREDFQNSRIKILDSPLLSELPTIKYSYNSRGKLVIESKESMRRRGLKSPDLSDALCITHYTYRKHYETNRKYQIEKYTSIGSERIFVPEEYSAGCLYDLEFGNMDRGVI